MERGGDPDFEGTICLLDALDAIDWTKVNAPLESVEAQGEHIGAKSAQGRKRIEKRPIYPPRQAEGESRP